MHKFFLVKFTLQISCQWMGIERYKLSALFELFYIEKWMNFSFFYSRTVLDHISLVFHYFELIFLFNDRFIYGQVTMVCFWGVWSPPPPPPPSKKGYPFLGLSKLT